MHCEGRTSATSADGIEFDGEGRSAAASADGIETIGEGRCAAASADGIEIDGEGRCAAASADGEDGSLADDEDGSLANDGGAGRIVASAAKEDDVDAFAARCASCTARRSAFVEL